MASLMVEEYDDDAGLVVWMEADSASSVVGFLRCLSDINTEACFCQNLSRLVSTNKTKNEYSHTMVPPKKTKKNNHNFIKS
jgi:hypothetical protein